MLKQGSMRNNFAPMKVIILEDNRFFICHVKTLNLIPAVMANEHARIAGCEEAIFHRDGRVTECAHSNVHIIKNGVFHTAPKDNLILPGITRAHLLKVCARLGIPTDETPFQLEDLFTADEIIISSAGTLCPPVSHIDGKPVGGKDPATLNKLRSAMIADFEAVTGAVLPKK
jgi:D-alanine transaminase